MDFFASTFPSAVSCFRVPHHRMLVRCEPGPKCFCLAKEVLLRRFEQAALDAGTDVSLSEEEAEPAVVVAELVLPAPTLPLHPQWGWRRPTRCDHRRMDGRCNVALVQVSWLVSDHFCITQSMQARISSFVNTAGASSIAARHVWWTWGSCA